MNSTTMRSRPHPERFRRSPASARSKQPDDTFTVLASLDGRYLSTEVAGGFTGRVVGLYAAAGTVHIDWFGYEPLDD